MTPAGFDPEEIARLLEGKLDAPRRAELIARLAASEEGAEVLAEAIAIDGDLRGEKKSDVLTIVSGGAGQGKAGRRNWRSQGWWALAAAVVGVVVLSRATKKGGSDGAIPESGDVVLLLSSRNGLPGNFDLSPWSATRGSSDGVGSDARAVRIGARLIDLDLMVRGRDSSAARTAGEIASLLDGMPGASTVAVEYRALSNAGDVGGMEGGLSVAASDAATIIGSSRLAVGEWLEAARIAARRGDSTFFRNPGTGRLLDAAKHLSIASEARSAFEKIEKDVRAVRLDFPSLGEQSGALLATLAR